MTAIEGYRWRVCDGTRVTSVCKRLPDVPLLLFGVNDEGKSVLLILLSQPVL